MEKIYKLQDNEFLRMTWEVSSGLTSNCGMKSLCNLVITKEYFTSWCIQSVPLDDCKSAVDTNWDRIYGALLESLGLVSIVGMSDLVFYEGELPDTYAYRTGDFVRDLIQRNLGVITASPVQRNFNYAEGEHDIQAWWWIPPDKVKGILPSDSKLITRWKEYKTECPPKASDKITTAITFSERMELYYQAYPDKRPENVTKSTVISK